MRPQRLDLSTQIRRKEILELCSQHLAQHKKLQIGNTPLSIFQSRKGSLTGIPSSQLQFHSEMLLGPALLLTELAHLRPDYI